MSNSSRVVLQHLTARRSNQRRDAGMCLVKTARRFLVDETGATAIEYGLIAAGIALAIVASVTGLGSKLSTRFGTISTSLR